MPQEDDIRKALREGLKKRGFQATIAQDLGVTATTIMRWDKGGEIPPPMLKLLDWYFFAVVPPRIAAPSTDLRGVLEFDEAEWRMITIMAARDGNKSPGKWIATRIRDYLALLRHDMGAQTREPITSISSLKVAEDPPKPPAKRTS